MAESLTAERMNVCRKKIKMRKGHYRFCEALFLLGETDRAVSSNKKAQELCRYCPDGIRDLVQQHARFMKDMEVAAGMKVKKNPKKKRSAVKNPFMPVFFESWNAEQFTPVVENKDPKNAPSKLEDVPDKDSAPECNLENRECTENMTGKRSTGAASPHTGVSAAHADDLVCGLISAQQPKKGKSKGKGSDSEKLRVSSSTNETQKMSPPVPSQVDLATLKDTVKSLVREAYEALNDKRCRNAEGIFSKLMDILEQSDLQSLQLTKLDYVVLQYGHANALLGVGQYVELVKAESQFKGIIQQHSKERFNCLAFYGIGNVYFRQNRFSDALNQYIKSKTMANHKMVPGVLTWPTTSVVIEETRPEKLQVLLDNCIEECKFPPKPDAICRYEQCGLPKAQIYFSDPDFKGFIRMVCCQFCRVEFHVCCWKKMKAAVYSDKNDKDFLKYSCLTPDCRGSICHIVIFDCMAQVKCEFEDKSVKKKEPQKPSAKHKTTSNKSNKIKYENKSERKKAIEDESVGNPDDSKKPPQEAILPEAAVTNGHRGKWDPLLAQVIQKEGLIKRGCPVLFPSFWESVFVWRIISPEKLEELERNSGAQSSSRMKSFLTYLYELNDRVKTRIFLYLLLLQADHITVTLHDWLLIVNNKGLEAAVEFRDHNRERLQNIKPENVVNLWNETYGKNINYMVTDYSAHNLFDFLTSINIEGSRFFLWLLEENKHMASEYGLEKELDKYFQEMDIPRGQVPKHSFENYNNTYMALKTKHKKKKRNQPVKPTYKLSGAVSTRSQEEDIFTEENTLSLLDPNEPFSVPESLRTDVDDFEALYEMGLLTDNYRELEDDSIEPIRETLYEYFAQILDENGPLKADDVRLIGEYEDFPEETHRMVEAAGGLKNFLLQSDEFTIVEDMIALSANYYISFGEQRAESHLNPTAEEFTPSLSSLVYSNCGLEYRKPPALYVDLDRNYRKFAEPYKGLYIKALPGSGCELMEDQNIEYPVLDDDLDEVHSVTSDGSESCSIYEEDDDDDDHEPSIDLSQDQSYLEESTQSDEPVSLQKKIHPKNIQTAIVSVQVDIEYSHHEVNTDPFQPFETQQGDILRMEKEHIVLRDQLQEATDKYDHLQSRYQEEITGLEEQIRNAVESCKIAKVELVYFQQAYESESKKWQQERKENQEKLKTLKSNIRRLTESNEKYSKGIEEKKKQYGAHIEEFAKIHCSKFENDKAKLEKHISKREADKEEAAQRAAVAEVLVLENKKQAELLRLRIQASNAEQSIKMLKPLASSKPATLEQISNMESYLLTLRKQMESLQSEFDENITALKKSAGGVTSPVNLPARPLSPDPSAASSSPVSSNPSPSPIKPSHPVPAKSPGKKTAANKKAQQKVVAKPQSNSHKPKTPTPSPAKVPAAAGSNRRGQPETKASPSAKPTLFDKIIQELHDIFPHYKSAELAGFIKDFRARNNGTLSGFSQDDITSRVTEHILDCQARCPPPAATQTTASNNSGFRMAQPPPPQPKQPWRVVTGGAKNKWQNSDDLESFGEDPCIICHDELKQSPVHKLDCGHYFHKHCIKTWLHTQSTCPTCREHALLPEDFPVLSGRMRTA